MSASARFLIRGFRILNFSLKVLIEIGSFMRVSTVCRKPFFDKQNGAKETNCFLRRVFAKPYVAAHWDGK